MDYRAIEGRPKMRVSEAQAKFRDEYILMHFENRGKDDDDPVGTVLFVGWYWALHKTECEFDDSELGIIRGDYRRVIGGFDYFDDED
ncbi:MAG: hypothetical protein FWB71_01545 [Defluviitaleaceae bacterium]|nr:hypothetical protein [Defluviitaleaceae bacterium]